VACGQAGRCWLGTGKEGRDSVCYEVWFEACRLLACRRLIFSRLTVSLVQVYQARKHERPAMSIRH